MATKKKEVTTPCCLSQANMPSTDAYGTYNYPPNDRCLSMTQHIKWQSSATGVANWLAFIWQKWWCQAKKCLEHEHGELGFNFHPKTSPGAILIYWLRLACLQLQLSCSIRL